jgi:alkaline phosphatase D
MDATTPSRISTDAGDGYSASRRRVLDGAKPTGDANLKPG